MNKIIRLLACAGLLAASVAAQAASYQFSYHFLDGEVVAGSFDGNANGNLITDLSNIAISVNGVAFGGGTHFYSFGFGPGGPVSGDGVASFDGKANQFLFVNADILQGEAPTHSLLSGAFNGGETDTLAFYSMAGGGYGEGDGADPYSAARWSVTAVPEPATYVMLLGGLALTGALARRRQA